MRLATFVLMLTGAVCMVAAGLMVHAMVQASVADAALRTSVDDSLRNAFFVFVSGITALGLAVVIIIASRMDELAARVKALEEKLAPPSPPPPTT